MNKLIADMTMSLDGFIADGCPVFVVSNSIPGGWPRDDSPTTFYTDPAAALAAARATAGDRDVVVATPTLTRQYLNGHPPDLPGAVGRL